MTRRSILIVFLILLFTSTACLLPPLSGLLSNNNPPSHGIFLKQNRSLESLEENEGEPGHRSTEGIPTADSNSPEFVIWLPQLNLSYFSLTSTDTNEKVEVNYSSQKEDILQAQPESNLESGRYCFVQGDPLGSPYSLPHWCFDVPETDSAGNLIPTTAVPTRTPTLDPNAQATALAAAKMELDQAENAATLSAAETVIMEATALAATQEAQAVATARAQQQATQIAEETNCENVLARVENGDYSDFVPGANFDSCELKNLDLFGFDLTNASFRDANLSNTNFSKTNLTNADFYGAYLSGTNFSNAVMDNVNLSAAIIANTNFHDTDLDEKLLDQTMVIIGDNYSFTFGSPLSWSPDGKRLAVANSRAQDHGVEIWDPIFGELVTAFGDPIDDLEYHLAWNPQTPYLAFSDYAPPHIWNTSNWKKKTILGETNSPTALAWHPSGRYLAVSYENHPIQIWDMEAEKIITTVNTDWVKFMNWSPNGRYLIYAGFKKPVECYDFLTDSIAFRITAHNYRTVENISWSPDSTRLATLDAGSGMEGDSVLYIWRLDSRGKLRKTDQLSDEEIYSTSWTADGQYLIIGMDHEENEDTWDQLLLYDPVDKNVDATSELVAHTDPMAWSPSTSHLAVVNNYRELMIYPFKLLFPHIKLGPKIEPEILSSPPPTAEAPVGEETSGKLPGKIEPISYKEYQKKDDRYQTLQQLISVVDKETLKHQIYYAEADRSTPIVIYRYWATTTQDILEENWPHLNFKFSINGEYLEDDYFGFWEGTVGPVYDEWAFYGYGCLATDWPPGEYHITLTMTIDETINDGADNYPPGDYVREFYLTILE